MTGIFGLRLAGLALDEILKNKREMGLYDRDYMGGDYRGEAL
ncbi:MAG: hypothetical protein ACLUKN_02805 [Bacilli bacterium]